MTKHKVDSLVDLVTEKDSLKKQRVYPLPEEESWKITLMKEIALAKMGQLDLEFDENNLDKILEAICTD